MSTLSIRLPDYLHKSVKKIALQEHSSLNQLIVLAVAEKLAMLTTEDYLAQRAAQGNRKNFLAVLNKASRREPKDSDRL